MSQCEVFRKESKIEKHSIFLTGTKKNIEKIHIQKRFKGGCNLKLTLDENYVLRIMCLRNL